MKTTSEWQLLYTGTGSVTGNDWLEEVCYLGQEKWLLSHRDDPAWSIGEVEVQEPDEKSSAELAVWVQDMDAADGEEAPLRVQSLLKIATEVGAPECVAILRRFMEWLERDRRG